MAALRRMDVLPRLVAACFCVLLMGSASCRRPADTPLRRIALLPADVLAPDAPPWMRSAVPVVLQHDLSTSASIFAVPAAGDSEAYRAGAAETVEITVDSVGGRYAVSGGERSLSTQRITPLEAGANASGFLSALDAMAKAVDPAAAPFSTRDEAALGQYVSALQTSDPAKRLQYLRDAVRKAPGFGAAQMELIASEARAGAPDLAATVAAAQQHRSEFDKVDGARFDALIPRLTPHSAAQRIAAANAAIQLTPNDPDMLVGRARERFLMGDAAGGEQDIRRASELRGASPQLQTELLQGLVQTRQFAKAAELIAQQAGTVQTPASLLEEGTCWLLAGDANKADAVVSAALKPQSADDQLAALRRAEWMAAKDDVAGAAALASNPSSVNAEAAAAGEAQAAIWYLQLERRAEARPLAASSLRRVAGAGPMSGARQFAQLAFLLADSHNGAELSERLAAAHAQGAGRDTVLAFGLFLYGDYARAAEAWRAIYAASGETDQQSRIMLAASYARMSRSADAAAIHALPMLPNLTGADPFATLAFGEMRRLLRP